MANESSHSLWQTCVLSSQMESIQGEVGSSKSQRGLGAGACCTDKGPKCLGTIRFASPHLCWDGSKVSGMAPDLSLWRGNEVEICQRRNTLHPSDPYFMLRNVSLFYLCANLEPRVHPARQRYLNPALHLPGDIIDTTFWLLPFLAGNLCSKI